MPQVEALNPTSGDDSRRLALLIDADNAQPSVIEGLLAEVARFGVAGIRRIYGDWTSTQHTQWKACLLKHSITPIQQFAYTTGRNATDSALIIDAMDLMYGQRLDGFCLVSSDSDFTRLAQRLREAGKLVYGFGERKTPKPFVAACDKFIYTELLRKPADAGSPARDTAPSPAKGAATAIASKPEGVGAVATAVANDPASPVEAITRAIEQAADEAGWAHLGAVGNYLTKIQPDFDPRLYGCRKLSELVRQYPDRFQTSERGIEGVASKSIYAKAIAQPPEQRAR